MKYIICNIYWRITMGAFTKMLFALLLCAILSLFYI